MQTVRRHYAIAEIRHSNLCPSDSMTVLAFGSPSDRDAWADRDGVEIVKYLQTHGETRRAISREEAHRALTATMGGYDRDALHQLPTWPSTLEETREAE